MTNHKSWQQQAVELSARVDMLERILNRGFDYAAHAMFKSEAKDVRIEELEAWKSRAMAAMNRVINEDYERPVSLHWFADNRPSKHDKCPHSLSMWEDCEQCTMGAINAILREAMTPQNWPESPKRGDSSLVSD